MWAFCCFGWYWLSALVWGSPIEYHGLIQYPCIYWSLSNYLVSFWEDKKYFFLKKIYLFIIWVICSCLQTLQKRASDLFTDGCEPPCGCRDLSSGPLEEQSVLLTMKPSPQPIKSLQAIKYFLIVQFFYILCSFSLPNPQLISCRFWKKI